MTHFTLALSALAAGSLLFMQSSSALPLLAENAVLSTDAALTAYPDHEDPNKFYFFPNSSKIALQENGRPLLSFVYWGLNDPAATEKGAYMTFTTKISSDSDQKKAMKAFLQQKKGRGLAVLPVQKSIVQLNTTSPDGIPLKALFEEFNFPYRGGRAEDEVGVNAVLTYVGAKTFRSILLDENPALKIDYCYLVQGLGPDMDAKIYVHMNRVYTHFRTSVSSGWGWFKKRIQREVEKLIARKDIYWEINGGNASDQEYTTAVVEDIIQRLFKPELKARPGDFNDNSWGQSIFTLSSDYTKRTEDKHEVWNFKRRDLVNKEFCLPLNIKDLQRYADEIVIDADAH